MILTGDDWDGQKLKSRFELKFWKTELKSRSQYWKSDYLGFSIIRGVPVELLVTGTDIFGENFACTGICTDIFHATCVLAFKDIVYSVA